MTRLRLLALAVALVVFAASCGGGNARRSTTTSSAEQLQLGSPNLEFGWIRSLEPLGKGYVMWFDLGQELRGSSGAWSTGARRCVTSGDCPTVTTVRGIPDDFDATDLRYALPYYVPARTPVVLAAPQPVPCTVRELYLLAHGGDPRHLRERAQLPSSLQYVFGWWIRVARAYGPSPHSLESVVRIEQQWHP